MYRYRKYKHNTDLQNKTRALWSVVDFECDQLCERESARHGVSHYYSLSFILLQWLQTVLKCTRIKVDVVRVMFFFLQKDSSFTSFFFVSAFLHQVGLKLEPENNNFFNLFFVLCCRCFCIHERCMWMWDWRKICDAELSSHSASQKKIMISYIVCLYFLLDTSYTVFCSRFISIGKQGIFQRAGLNRKFNLIFYG